MIETERNIWTLQELARVKDIDNSVIGFKRCEYPFIEAFWAYNERNLNTNRETIKCTIADFIKMGRTNVYHTSLGLYPGWDKQCANWSCQTDPAKQYCLIPKIWAINEWLTFSYEVDNIIGKNLADDTVIED